MPTTREIKACFFVNDEIAAIRFIHNAPHVGDEVILNGEQHFKVKRLIWSYDELDSEYERLNIELVSVD